MDDYFNFDEASDFLPLGSSCPSDRGQVDEADATDCFESLFWDKSASLPTDPPSIRRVGVDTTSIPSVPIFSSDLTGDDGEAYPMHRAKEPCDLCKQRGLECFIAQRGALLHGCTCCINLYRECSFTHKQTPGVWMATLGPVGEDIQIDSGEIVGKAVMKSIPGAYNYEDSQARKTGGRFSRDSVKVLKAWLSAHANHPYPTDQEKDDLKHLTGLKRSQISNWLANARRRGKVRPPVDEPVYPNAIEIPRPTTADPELANLDPMERWKRSPPEHEPAAMTAIARAVSATTSAPGAPPTNPNRSRQNSSRQNSSHHQSSKKSSSNDESSFSMFQAPSISSFATGQSEATSLSSYQSGYSHGSLKERKDRRRRRRTPLPKSTLPGQKYRGARIFQCTFCTDTFAAKYDWTRHEKSLHLALERWTCAPQGAVIVEDGIRRCVFCSAANPDPAHLESHNYGTCEEKTAQERTFYRKDHLRQHLRLLHGCTYHPRMDAWKSQTTAIKSRCGFCPAEFSTWNQRADHLAAHFKNGSDMSQWQGSWGFEPYVDRLVENSMPPFMIAIDRNSMDPFVATRRTNSTTSEAPGPQDPSSSVAGSTPQTSLNSARGVGDQIFHDSNCWRRCELMISQYIQDELRQGRKPNDAQLQTRARWVIFGDDDPWNQTPADNKQWLTLVKKANGLENGDKGVEVPKLPTGETVTRVEELPMNPPYCIPGGLKRARKIEAVEGVATSLSEHRPSTVASSKMPVVDPALEGGVESIDFSALDFSMIDDSLDLTRVDLNSYVLGAPRHPLTSNPPSGPSFSAVPDVFSGPGMEMELDQDQYQPTTSSMGMEAMPATSGPHEYGLPMAQLNQYMSSFRQ